METAKVDIRKLQLLNDRINQCIDALAQVRLSVHGLTHSNPVGQMQNIGNIGNPFSQSGIGTQQLGSQGFGQGFGQGQPFGQGYGQQGLFGQQGQQNPFWTQQQGVGGIGGLSHTTPDVLEYSRPTWADPYLAARVNQTFPYAQLQVPPVVSLY